LDSKVEQGFSFDILDDFGFNYSISFKNAEDRDFIEGSISISFAPSTKATLIKLDLSFEEIITIRTVGCCCQLIMCMTLRTAG